MPLGGYVNAGGKEEEQKEAKRNWRWKHDWWINTHWREEREEERWGKNEDVDWWVNRRWKTGWNQRRKERGRNKERTGWVARIGMCLSGRDTEGERERGKTVNGAVEGVREGHGREVLTCRRTCGHLRRESLLTRGNRGEDQFRLWWDLCVGVRGLLHAMDEGNFFSKSDLPVRG